MNSLQDQELLLAFDDQRATVSTLGASLRRYYRVQADGAPLDILWGYSGSANKQGGQGDVLIPFPSRIKAGRYTFQGKTHQMEINDKEGPNAIHGFLRNTIWSHEQKNKNAITFKTELAATDYASEGYPFSLDIRLDYLLDKGGLTCRFEIKNIGPNDAPMGVGFHPYFTVNTGTLDEAEIEIPATQFLEFEALVPTGKLLSVIQSGLDFRTLKKIEKTKFNHCFTQLLRDRNGMSRVVLRNPDSRQRITVWMDRAFDFLVIYTGEAIAPPDNRRAIAIEPMTCGTDAFNHEHDKDWGLKVLQPSEVFTGSFGISSNTK